MAIRAAVFDIGGVLKIIPDLGLTGLWEKRLGLRAGEFGQRMRDVWAGGTIGAITVDVPGCMPGCPVTCKHQTPAPRPAGPMPVLRLHAVSSTVTRQN